MLLSPSMIVLLLLISFVSGTFETEGASASRNFFSTSSVGVCNGFRVPAPSGAEDWFYASGLAINSEGTLISTDFDRKRNIFTIVGIDGIDGHTVYSQDLPIDGSTISILIDSDDIGMISGWKRGDNSTASVLRFDTRTGKVLTSFDLPQGLRASAAALNTSTTPPGVLLAVGPQYGNSVGLRSYDPMGHLYWFTESSGTYYTRVFQFKDGYCTIESFNSVQYFLSCVDNQFRPTLSIDTNFAGNGDLVYNPVSGYLVSSGYAYPNALLYFWSPSSVSNRFTPIANITIRDHCAIDGLSAMNIDPRTGYIYAYCTDEFAAFDAAGKFLWSVKNWQNCKKERKKERKNRFCVVDDSFSSVGVFTSLPGAVGQGAKVLFSASGALMIVESETGSLLYNASFPQANSLYQSVISGSNIYLSLPTTGNSGSGYELSCFNLRKMKPISSIKGAK